MKALNKKDLINIGIFNAVAVALYFAIGVATSGVPVLHVFGVTPIAALISGAIYLLMVMKVKKKGVFLISGIVQGIVFSLMLGLYASIVIIPLLGFIADMICGNFSAKKLLVTAYGIFMVGIYYGQIFSCCFSQSSTYRFTVGICWRINRLQPTGSRDRSFCS